MAPGSAGRIQWESVSVTTPRDRARRAAAQRARRMAHRRCGHCGEPADVMVVWDGRQEIPFCHSCHCRLNAASPAPYCSFNEVDPGVLRPAARSAAIPEPTDRQEEDARSGNMLRRAWEWLMEEEE